MIVGESQSGAALPTNPPDAAWGKALVTASVSDASGTSDSRLSVKALIGVGAGAAGESGGSVLIRSIAG
jgi:hypothetical protein